MVLADDAATIVGALGGIVAAIVAPAIAVRYRRSIRKNFLQALRRNSSGFDALYRKIYDLPIKSRIRSLAVLFVSGLILPIWALLNLQGVVSLHLEYLWGFIALQIDGLLLVMLWFTVVPRHEMPLSISPVSDADMGKIAESADVLLTTPVAWLLVAYESSAAIALFPISQEAKLSFLSSTTGVLTILLLAVGSFIVVFFSSLSEQITTRPVLTRNLRPIKIQVRIHPPGSGNSGVATVAGTVLGISEVLRVESGESWVAELDWQQLGWSEIEIPHESDSKFVREKPGEKPGASP